MTTQVTWSNGDVTDEPVIWGEIDPSLLAQPGEVSVSGTIQGWDGQVSCTVTVEALEVVSVEQPADVSTAAGTAPVLPATVRVSWDNGTTTDEPMTWDEVDPASYHDGGTFTVSGQVGQTGQTASVNVVVAPATPVSAEPVAATTPAGIAPQLSPTARVTWSNGDVTDEQVTWNGIDAALYANAGSFDVEGAFAGREIGFKATANVTVGNPIVVGVGYVNDVSTVAGVAPTLPETIPATLSDGSQTMVPVTWDAIDAGAYGHTGTFVVSGTVDGSDQTAQVTVKVASATVSSVEQVVSVTTTAGTKPALPDTVEFTWSDGKTTRESVSWSRIDEQLYQQAGTFEVSGIASGWGVTAKVTVEASETDISPTGDASVGLGAIVATALAGAAAAVSSLVLRLRGRGRE